MAEQITIATIGTPDVHENTKGVGTGAGKVVMLETPEGTPDVKVNVIRPVIAIAVRFGHLFLKTFVGAISIDALGLALGGVKAAALLALATASIGLAQDCVTVFKQLEGKYPLMTGSI